MLVAKDPDTTAVYLTKHHVYNKGLAGTREGKHEAAT